MRDRVRGAPSVFDKPPGRIAGGDKPLPGGAYGVYEIRIASQINLRSRATARTNGLSVRFATRRKYLATARLRNRAASDQWPRPWTEHTWAANLHRKLTLRHRARFAAKNKRREPEFFLAAKPSLGLFLAPSGEKSNLNFDVARLSPRKTTRNPGVIFPRNRPCFFFGSAP